MGDSSFDPGPESEFDRRLDDRLRHEFTRTFSSSEAPNHVLQDLAPSFRRARRIHHAKQGALAVAASVLLLGGVGALTRSLATDEAQVTVAGEVDGIEGDAAQAIELEVTGTTVNQGPQSADEDDEVEGVAEESSATSSPPTSVESEDPGSSTTARDTTTTSATVDYTFSTSIAGDGSVTVRTDCGSIVVMPSGSSVQLLDVLPDSGYSSDVKSSGSEKVEVGFEEDDDGGHCEIEARMSDGELEVELEE